MAHAKGAVLPLKGSTTVPPDKSVSHRALMLASMAEGKSHLRNLLDSKDVRSTLACMRALGAHIETTPADNGSFDAEVTGWGPLGPSEPDEVLDCGNSGTTARLLMGIIAGSKISATLTGDDSLVQRPMARIAEPLSRMGAAFAHANGTPWEGGAITLPLTVRGAGVPAAISYDSPKASAQVKTSIILAGLACPSGCTTNVTEPSKSRDHTELMLPAFGVDVDVRGNTVSMRGGQRLVACDIEVPGDPSSAMFLVAAAAMVPGSDIEISGVGLNPTRTGGFDLAARMGCDIVFEKTGGVGDEPCGNVRVRYREELSGTVAEPSEIPYMIDEIPILALLATHASGTTEFCGVSELRVKESNRLSAIVEGLNTLGCAASERGDDLLVSFGAPTRSVELDPLGDHRLAMTWVLANRCHDLGGQVLNLECIEVSYPRFIEGLDALQGGVDR